MTNQVIPKRRHKPGGAALSTRKARQGWFFVLPFIIGILLVYAPIVIDSIWFSFNTLVKEIDPVTQVAYNVVKPAGFTYYREALQNEEFISTLLSGAGQLVLNVPAIVIFSLFIAVILNQKMLGRAAFRAIFFIPVILATGLMEAINLQDMLSGSIEGGIDTGAEGGGELISMMDIDMLFSNMKVGRELVTYVLGLVNRVYEIINDSGVQMLIFLAGLQSISPSIYEACQIEGATSWETFWKITFPMISPMILVNLIYTIIDSFTKEANVVMAFIERVHLIPRVHLATAMSWLYFLMVLLIVAAFAAIASSFVFYQKRD
ncbi:MAG: sugar ABC transporter permease [Eubacteriales bacterium]